MLIVGDLDDDAFGIDVEPPGGTFMGNQAGVAGSVLHGNGAVKCLLNRLSLKRQQRLSGGKNGFRPITVNRPADFF